MTRTVVGAKQTGVLLPRLLATPSRAGEVPCSVFPFVCLEFQLMSRKVLIHAWHNMALISAADARCCRNTKK